MISKSSKLLALDLSTTATGWSIFDISTKKLVEYGVIYSAVKNSKKNPMVYPELQVSKMRDLITQILDLLKKYDFQRIVIEEINRGKNRLGQKVLDGFHFMLLDHLPPADLKKVIYCDSDGADGWRSAAGLNLRLSESDKLLNKDRKKVNKKLHKKEKKHFLITQKTLACKYVNKVYKLELDSDKSEKDGDIADSIGLGHFILHFWKGKI